MSLQTPHISRLKIILLFFLFSICGLISSAQTNPSNSQTDSITITPNSIPPIRKVEYPKSEVGVGGEGAGGGGGGGCTQIQPPNISVTQPDCNNFNGKITINGYQEDNGYTYKVRKAGPITTILGSFKTNSFSLPAGYTYEVWKTILDCESGYVSFTINSSSTVITTDVRSEPYTVEENETAPVLSIIAQGPGLSYQWFKNNLKSTEGGAAISGATGADYIPVVNTLGITYYYVKVSGTCETVTSGISTVNVINTAPVNGIIVINNLLEGCPNSNTASLEIIPSHSSAIPLTYLWEFSHELNTGFQPTGASSMNYDALNLPVTTYFRVKITSNDPSNPYTNYTPVNEIRVKTPTEVINDDIVGIYTISDGVPPVLWFHVTGVDLHYEWYQNTVNSNQNGTAFPNTDFPAGLPDISSLGTFYQYVKATGTCGSVTSGVAELIVTDIPCQTTSQYPEVPTTVNTSDLIEISSCNYFKEYSTISGIITGFEYEFSGVENVSGNLAYITVRSDSFDGPIIGAGFSPLTVTAPVDGSGDNLYVHWNANAECGNASACATTTVLCVTCTNIEDCEGVVGGSALPLFPCDDGDETTINDVYNHECICAGEPATEGEACASAIPIFCNAEPITYSSANYKSTNDTECFMGDKGVWFSFTGTGSDITINSSASFDHEMSINSGSCGDFINIGCRDRSISAESYTISPSIDGETYYVYIAHYANKNTTTGDITIDIDCQSCTSPSLDLVLQDIYGNEIQGCLSIGSEYYVSASVSGGVGNESYNITASASTPVTIGADESAVLGPFAVGSDVFVLANGNDDNACGAGTSISSPTFCGPGNDDCNGAIALECGQPISGYTISATPSNLDTQCGLYESSDARDVWYSFEADGSSSYTVTVSTTTSNWDGVLFVYSGNCTALLTEACADNAPSPYNGPESITLDDLAAGTYYVRTFSYFGVSSFTIELTCCHAGNIAYVNANATGTNNGSSWTDAYTNLQDALRLSCTNINEIWVAKGTYFPDKGGVNTLGNRKATFMMKNNLAIYGGFAGTETIRSQRNPVTNPSILSGNIGAVGITSDNSYNVVTNPGTNNTSRLDGFIITGGNANGSEFANTRGGGIHNADNTTAIIANCIFKANHAQFGGGIYTKTATNPSIINCLITGNTALFGGGGICNSTYGSSTVINTTIVGNGKQGVQNYANSTSTLKNCIIWGNEIGISGSSTVSYSIVQGGGYTTNGNLSSDPLFVDASNGNYRLQNGSPAMNAGDNTANNESFDLDGNQRKVGVIEMGAYENNGCSYGNILYVNAIATGENDGSSWANAFNSLQEALSLTCTNVTQIWVAKGTYQPQVNASFSMKKGVAIYGGFNDIGNPAMEDRDWQTYPTILKGNGNRVINNNFTSTSPLLASAELNGFTITEGSVTGQSQSGAGIYNNYASPVLTNLIISGNSASWNGGGIFNNYSSPVITNSIVSGNKATWGGGFYNNNSSFPIITNVTISGNKASSGGGGVINVNSSPKIRNSIIYGNAHGVNDFGGNSFSEITYSLVQGLTVESNGNLSGGKNPMFVSAPSFNTAPFAGGDYSLLASSPAINTGNNQAYIDASGKLISDTDLAGNPRLVDDIIDMGAFEYKNIPPNDNCSNAITLTVNEHGDCAGNETNGTTINATSDGVGIGCEPLNPDVFYTFNSGNNTQVLVNIGTLDPEIDIVLTVFEESCEGAILSCNYGTNIIMVEVNPLVNYLLRVSSNTSFGHVGDFTICIEGAYQCPALQANIGDACDDGNPGTTNDTVDGNCNCIGTPVKGALNGNVNWNSNCAARNAIVKLYEPGTATLPSTYAVTIQSDGSFNIPELDIGTFDVIVKVEGYLAKGTQNVVIAVGENSLAVGALVFGDINSDNIVDFIDLGALSGVYLSQIGQAEYDPIADSNCDGIIDFVDLGALSGSYLIIGDAAPLLPSGDE